jgi:hypothetical protein
MPTLNYSDLLNTDCAATSAVASSIYGLIQTHPNDPSRPLVDFDVALTFIPALLLGVSFGKTHFLKSCASSADGMLQTCPGLKFSYV